MVNLNMDTSVWRQARIAAAEDDTTLTKIIEMAMKEFLDKRHFNKKLKSPTKT
jgi:hypothetical protein